MTLRRAKPVTFQPTGLSDAVDGSNAFPGAMTALQNLIPNPSTKNTWVPRPASVQVTDFSGFTTPGPISALLVVGNIAYGMISTGRNPGKDEPFAYNLLTNTFLPVGGVTSANVPTSPAGSGDWTPPCMAVVGSRVVVTHSGFPGGAPGPYFGWFDISGFTDTTHTGNTHSSTLIDSLSANVLQAGWNVGMTISGAGIPAGTTIKAIAADGLSLTLSQAATATGTGVALSVAGGTAAAPLWGAGNTNGNPLKSVPVSVAQMAGRAYFAVGTGVVLSDSGNATQVTNATQALLFNNGLATTVVAGLPLSSPLTGGIIQAIVAFQGTAAIQVITGDPASNNLSVNLAKAGTGTLAPLSVVPFNQGLAFVSPEGLRIVDFYARVSDPIGAAGSGVSVPFIYAIAPSRICAAANASVLRISVQNGNASGQPYEEYWFDLTRKVWSGPHSFPAGLIQPWGTSFLIAAQGLNGKLWRGDVAPSTGSTYTENGAALAWAYQTVLAPDTGDMAMHAMVEAAIAADYPPAAQATVQALDEAGSVLDTVFMMGSGQPGTFWNNFTWGEAPWLGGSGSFQQRRISWHVPIVFKQAALRVTGPSLGGLVLGNLYLRYQELGYMLESTA